MTESAENRRRHFRFPVQDPVPCLVRVEGSANTAPPLPGKLHNISVGGALLELARRVPQGTIVAVGAATKTGSIEIEGEVVWVTTGPDADGIPTHVHGVQFSVMDGEMDPVLEELFRSFVDGPAIERERRGDTR